MNNKFDYLRFIYTIKKIKMNIFYLDHDPKLCAEYHNDRHVIKMILESAQLLSTAHRILDGKEYISKSNTGRNVKRWILSDFRENFLYSATHGSHPSAVWVRQSVSNYMWLSNLLQELCKEYTYRYGKVHKCEGDGLVQMLRDIVPDNIPLTTFTEPTPAMPDECIVPNDSIASYKKYYTNSKQHLASWKGKINSREIPAWYC
jgi:hypothetical protein